MTKCSAVLKKVLRDGDETALVLILEKPKTVNLNDGDRVFLELTNVVTGDKVQFPDALPVVQKVEADEEEFELAVTPAPEPLPEPVNEQPLSPVVDEISPDPEKPAEETPAQ